MWKVSKRISKIRVYPYKQGSASAKILAEKMGGKVLKHVNSKYAPRDGDIIINWGSSNPPDFRKGTTLNKDVKIASNKLSAFKKMKEEGVSIPDFYENKEEIPNGDEAYPIVCRTILNGHSGAGIVIADGVDDLVDAPLYTKYVKKADEYRVHVVRDEVAMIVRKARRMDVEKENVNWRVRNLAGGFVFVMLDEGDVEACVVEEAKKAIKALSLDFGGVDVIFNKYEGKAYVLEVNTACGLEDRTAEAYAQAFEKLRF